MGTRWGKVFGGEKTETTEPITSQMSICLKYCIHSHQTQGLMAKKKSQSLWATNWLPKKQQTNLLSFKIKPQQLLGVFCLYCILHPVETYIKNRTLPNQKFTTLCATVLVFSATHVRHESQTSSCSLKPTADSAVHYIQTLKDQKQTRRFMKEWCF